MRPFESLYTSFARRNAWAAGFIGTVSSAVSGAVGRHPPTLVPQVVYLVVAWPAAMAVAFGISRLLGARKGMREYVAVTGWFTLVLSVVTTLLVLMAAHPARPVRDPFGGVLVLIGGFALIVAMIPFIGGFLWYTVRRAFGLSRLRTLAFFVLLLTYAFLVSRFVPIPSDSTRKRGTFVIDTARERQDERSEPRVSGAA